MTRWSIARVPGRALLVLRCWTLHDRGWSAPVDILVTSFDSGRELIPRGFDWLLTSDLDTPYEVEWWAPRAPAA